MSAMRTALTDAGDLDTLGRHAHTIGSTSRHFPETELTDLARHIEALANAGELAAARTAFPDLEAAWTTLRTDLVRSLGAED